MQLTREAVARKLGAYLHQEISLDELVAWANVAMMEADFEEAYYDPIRDTIARLSLADVQAFELTWEQVFCRENSGNGCAVSVCFYPS